MKSRNMKLGTRIMMGYAVVLVFLVVTIFIGISRMTVSNGHLNLIINDRQAKMQLTYRMINEVNNIDIAMRNMAITGDETVLNNEKNKLEEARKIYRNAFEELSRIEVSEKGKQLLASIKEELGKGKNMNGKAIGMALDKKQTEASGIITTELSKTRLNVLNSLHALISFEEDMMKQAGEEAAQAYKSAWILMCLTGVVAVILSIVLATINIRSITRPINHTIEGMNDASAHVAAASAQIASSSQSLAYGAAEQASALEETSSSLEEMTSMTKQNADNANQAKYMMNETKQIVDEVDRQMNEMAEAINEITRTSEETGKIIRTIDEIAFQTNLLALNAAVEAARAGEAGAGFAVVADEVRSLAMRAAEAAKNTNGLIDNTIKAVHQGNELTQATREAFRENMNNAGKVAQLIEEIAAASQEQAEGIGQISKAVAEMDKVVQQTAANAEESASASEEMNAQAKQMKSFIGELTLLISGGTKTNGAISGNSSSIMTQSLTKKTVDE